MNHDIRTKTPGQPARLLSFSDAFNLPFNRECVIYIRIYIYMHKILGKIILHRCNSLTFSQTIPGFHDPEEYAF